MPLEVPVTTARGAVPPGASLPPSNGRCRSWRFLLGLGPGPYRSREEPRLSVTFSGPAYLWFMEDTENVMGPHTTTATALVERIVEGRPSLDGVARLLQPVAAAARGRGTWRSLVTGEVVGHAAHPFLTDLPIGFVISATLLDLVGGPGAETAARRLVGAGLVSAPAAALTGLAEYASLTERPRRVAAVHAALTSPRWGCMPSRGRCGRGAGPREWRCAWPASRSPVCRPTSAGTSRSARRSARQRYPVIRRGRASVPDRRGPARVQGS